jgi:hypothetical protein
MSDAKEIQPSVDDDLTSEWMKFESEFRATLTDEERGQFDDIIAGKDTITLSEELTREEEVVAAAGTAAPNTAAASPATANSVMMNLGATPNSTSATLESVTQESAPAAVPQTKVSGDVRVQIENMTIPQKIKAAMFGNKQCRAILIFDKNRMIQMFVLKNPKLGATEKQEFMQNPFMDGHVLRYMAGVREWMRDYKMKRALTFNPKTPLDISLRWIKFLNGSDIKLMARSKSVPQVLSVAAKKRLDQEGGQG